MKKLEIGDRIRLIKPSNLDEGPQWVGEMDRFLNKVLIVETLGNKISNICDERFMVEGGSYWFDQRWARLTVSRKAEKALAEYRARKAVLGSHPRRSATMPIDPNTQIKEIKMSKTNELNTVQKRIVYVGEDEIQRLDEMSPEKLMEKIDIVKTEMKTLKKQGFKKVTYVKRTLAAYDKSLKALLKELKKR